MTDVHVRIGVHRYAYHTDAECPSLNGKRETFRGIEAMPRERASQLGLKACDHCRQ